MVQKINFIVLLMALMCIQGCALNEYQKIKINDNSYLVTFDSGIPKSLQTKVNSTLKIKIDNQEGENIKISISNYISKQYDIYSGESLRSLESEIKASINLSMNNNNKTVNKTLMSMKRFGSVELNPLAEQEMIDFIENEILEDLFNQIILEVNLVDM
ncbi:MAG: hypothetical protein CMD40_02035 [Gammaproteobacteria bacterium]|nr:hypothetical protein [Gammaproteobacteria bacterium]